MKTEFTEACLE